MDISQQRIVLFDGVCNFCNSSVQFIIKRDPKGKFNFSPLQSDLGQKVLIENNLSPDNFNSFILLDRGKLYQKTSAALRVVKHLRGLWPILYIFIIVPPFIRNVAYTIIARNRYKWFGKKESCMIPTPEQRSRFIA